EPTHELRQHVAGGVALAALELQAPEVLERLANRVGAEVGDREAAEIDGLRFTVEAPAAAHAAHGGLEAVLAVVAVAAGGGAAAAPPRAAVRAVTEPRLVAFVLVRDGREARAVAGVAPAAARVVREHARIERLEAAPAARACALGREELAGRGAAVTAAAGRDDAHHAAAEPQRSLDRLLELRLVSRRDADLRDRQLDVVLLEAVDPRPCVGREIRAVDAQCRIPLVARPFGEIRVVALATDHERREEPDAPPAVFRREPRG